MENAKSVSTPLANHFYLSTSQCPRTVEETEDMSKVSYASAVGCLMYGYDMYQARFGSCSQCGEQVHGKSGKTALGCN
jgi:hypothetical protein